MELLARTCNTEQMNAFRIFARFFVVLGGLFWVSMIWGAKWAYEGAPLNEALGNALLWAALTAAIFIVGLFYEYIAAAVLAGGAVVVVALGIVVGWEAGVWGTVFFFFILPMLVAAALYALSARMQRICTY